MLYQERFPKALPDITGRAFPKDGHPLAAEIEVGEIAGPDGRRGFFYGEDTGPSRVQGIAGCG